MAENSYTLGSALCKALGLGGQMVQKLVIVCDGDEPVKVYAQMLMDGNHAQGVAEACKGISPDIIRVKGVEVGDGQSDLPVIVTPFDESVAIQRQIQEVIKTQGIGLLK